MLKIKLSTHKKQKYIIKGMFICMIVMGWYIMQQQKIISNYKLTEETLKKTVEDVKTDIKNIKDGLGLTGESKYEKTKYATIVKQAQIKTENYIYTRDLSDRQKQDYREKHGKTYKLRYDWMINPVSNSYMPLRGCEFGTPRMDRNGTIWGHTGADQKSLDTTDLQAPCDAVVSDIGFDSAGGYYVILKTVRQEMNLKTNLMENVTYENYLGHLTENITLTKGQEVKQGDSIAIMSNTGTDQCGVHCHWSIKRNGILMNPFRNTTYNNKFIE